MAKLLPIKIPPGMFRNGTEYESSGRWFAGDQIRWENGRLKPVGGWQNILLPGVALTGMARGGVTWEDNNGYKYIAIGTNSNLYIGTGDVFTDVTPTGMVAGLVDSILGPGYGAGDYGSDSGSSSYGTVRSGGGVALSAATWSFDTWGQDIVCVLSSDQTIYEFNVTTGTIAKVTNSPSCRAVFVTNEDVVMALGANGNARLIEWCDIGNDSNWTPTDTDAAGSINLNTGGACMNGARVGVQNLVWTDSDVHLINFIGSPGIYSPIRLAEGCGLVGPNAFAVTDKAYWMSPGGFFMYNGLVQPLACEVQDYIWNEINWLQAAKIYGEVNSRYNEIWFFFPSVNSNENDSYVVYNYKENIWYYGIQTGMGGRTMWLDRGTFPTPYAVDTNGIVYEHEVGYLANGATRVGNVWAESGPVQIGSGDKVIYSNLILPDVDPSPSAVQMTALCRQAPAGPVTTVGPVALAPNAEGYVPARFVARQASLRIDQISDENWSLGTMRVRVNGGGQR